MFAGIRRLAGILLAILVATMGVAPADAARNVASWLFSNGMVDASGFIQSATANYGLHHLKYLIIALAAIFLFQDFWRVNCFIVYNLDRRTREKIERDNAAVSVGSLKWADATLHLHLAKQVEPHAEVEIRLKNTNSVLLRFTAKMEARVNGATSPRGEISMEGYVHADDHTFLCYDRILCVPRNSPEARPFIEVEGHYEVRYWYPDAPKIIRTSRRKFRANCAAPPPGDAGTQRELQLVWRLEHQVEG